MDAQRLEWDTPMYRLAVAQLDRTAALMELDDNIWERLRTPQRALVVSFPSAATTTTRWTRSSDTAFST